MEKSTYSHQLAKHLHIDTHFEDCCKLSSIFDPDLVIIT